MLLAILSVCSEEELGEEADEDDERRSIPDVGMTPEEIAARRAQIKAKIMAVGKLQRVFQVLREESERASELDDMEAGDLRQRLQSQSQRLGVQGNEIGNHIHSFADAYVSFSFFFRNRALCLVVVHLSLGVGPISQTNAFLNQLRPCTQIHRACIPALSVRHFEEAQATQKPTPVRLTWRVSSRRRLRRMGWITMIVWWKGSPTESLEGGIQLEDQGL